MRRLILPASFQIDHLLETLVVIGHRSPALIDIDQFLVRVLRQILRRRERDARCQDQSHCPMIEMSRGSPKEAAGTAIIPAFGPFLPFLLKLIDFLSHFSRRFTFLCPGRIPAL